MSKSLRVRFKLNIGCPNCGEIHKISANEIAKTGAISCNCGKTIVIPNAKQFGEKLDELERLANQFGANIRIEKKEKKEEQG